MIDLANETLDSTAVNGLDRNKLVELLEMRHPRRRINAAIVSCVISAVSLLMATTPAGAVVKFSDGFGDADRDNNGVPLEAFDVDTGINDIAGDTWGVARLGPLPTDYNGNGIVDAADYTIWRDTPNLSTTDLRADGNENNIIDPNDYTVWAQDFGMTQALVHEVSTVLDANDVGLRWLGIRGTTSDNSATGDQKPFMRIVDDTTGVMQETFASGADPVNVPALNTGYALSFNSKGRGSSGAAFFGETVELGPQVGDQVKVSFDIRIWRDAPNANAFAQPEFSNLRFGLYEDTDDQLYDPGTGELGNDAAPNPFAGPGGTPAVWGKDEGLFEGLVQDDGFPGSEIGSIGDHGWWAQVEVNDPMFAPIDGSRINEEVNNLDGGVPFNSQRILQGNAPETDFVAEPDETQPFGQIDPAKPYRISLTLERATDTTPGDTIRAILTLKDLVTMTEVSMEGTEPLTRMVDDGMGGMMEIPDGISSEAWDYFAIKSDQPDEFDYLIDNFMLEIFGSNAGAGSAAAAVPEPSTIVLIVAGALALLAGRTQRWRVY